MQFSGSNNLKLQETSASSKLMLLIVGTKYKKEIAKTLTQVNSVNEISMTTKCCQKKTWSKENMRIPDKQALIFWTLFLLLKLVLNLRNLKLEFL